MGDFRLFKGEAMTFQDRALMNMRADKAAEELIRIGYRRKAWAEFARAICGGLLLTALSFALGAGLACDWSWDAFRAWMKAVKP